MSAFFDTQNWEWLNQCESSFSIIKKEIENLLSSKSNIIEPYSILLS
ncbi:hypothetical protein BH09BAC5_BH09BAC5_25270 [soil metagenome]